jgi:hypothetical protein
MKQLLFAVLIVIELGFNPTRALADDAVAPGVDRESPVAPAARDAESSTLSTGGRAVVDPGVRRVRPTNIQRINLAVGTHGHAGLGALVGAGAGLTLGIVAVTTCHEDCGGTSNPVDVPVIAGVLGGAIGALVGALIRTDVSRPVPLSDRRVSVNIAPTPAHGWRGRIAVRF